ncbi:MAG: HAD-IC family P-type ATPase [Deltaproteobacteria bacterium]|nr:HAD-IC family P-type ATPase [Deltaproteobacteria bacterium]
MDISALLKAVILDVKAADHETVLKELFRGLFPAITGEDRIKAFCDWKAHESTAGALSGKGAAIFHCFSEEVPDTVAAVGISKKGVGDKAGKVNIFFLLISPIKESGTHLQLLSNLEWLLLDKHLRNSIISARSAEDVKKAIKRAGGAVRSAYLPLDKAEVLRELDTSEKGLTSAEAERRLRLAGPNTLKKISRSALLKDFLHNLFLNLFAVLLWAGGLMSFTAGMPQLGWAIFLVIIINALFSFWQEYKAERAVEALKNLLPKKVRVIRDGGEMDVDAVTLVPGDLVVMTEGDGIPADGRLIEASDMRVDNSALTGESRPVYKICEPLVDGKGFIWTELPNLVFAGTGVLSGSGRMVVTATGMETEIGHVAYLTQAIKPEQSPLQKEMVRITKTVTVLAVTLGVAFFFLGWTVAGLGFAASFIFAIGIIVANVPEGLLPTVSLSLAMGVERMAGKKAVVKKLSSVETLGSATVICTDKTGTLTTNQMCVERIFVGNKLVIVTGNGYNPEGAFLYEDKKIADIELEKTGIRRLLTTASLCNNAALHPPSSTTGKEALSWTISGDPTEGAILTAGVKAGLDLGAVARENPRVAHIAFERIRKRMTTVHEAAGPGKKGHVIAFVKGAPKEVLELCTGIYSNNGPIKLSADVKEAILAENDTMASKGLRILAVAERTIERKSDYRAEEVEKDLVFIGLIAMLDPPRPEVKDAISACGTAGIKVVMVTGDYGLTAKAIANEIGLPKDARVVTGEELGHLSHAALKDVLKKGAVIFARVTPQDKLRVVTALQDNGEVVAATGDGVNDAPALKKADIGIAMGLRGSDVAKEAAEMVLMDDNFASIVEAVKEGRAVYSNIKKFVTYIFASNIPEIIPFVAFVIFRIPLPLTVMQILAVDLGTDILPALGLGLEPPEKGIMKEPPRPRGKRLLDFSTLTRAYLFLGLIEAVLCMSAFFFVYWTRGWRWGLPMPGGGSIYAAATTMSFAGIVASQIGNVFACRTNRESVFSAGFFRNRFVLWSLAAEAALALLLIYTPLMQRVFGFAPLTLMDWAYLSFFPVVVLGAEELRKAVLRRRAS